MLQPAAADRLVDVVRSVGGIHAQVQASAELQLAARVDDITQQDVRNALWCDRTLVKTWALRGTLHLHPADELPLWFAARRAARDDRIGGLEAWRDPNGVLHPPVTAAELAELHAAVWNAFEGRPLLRDELASAVVERIGPKHEARLHSGFAFFTSDLCHGPPQGNKITLARPDQWVAEWREVPERDALREVLRRFLHAYGPTRPRDFRSWFGADVSFDLVDVEEVDVAGQCAFVLAGDTEFPELAKNVHLLPEYDVFVMGFREREHLVPRKVRQQVAAHGRGRYEGPAGVRFVLVDGLAAGLWERKKSLRRIDISVAPAQRVSRRALQREAARFGAFFGVEPVLTLTGG